MNAIDHFIDELRRAIPAAVPEAERVEAAFHAMRVSDNPILIDEYDSMVSIAGQRRPLLERLQALLDLTERELP